MNEGDAISRAKRSSGVSQKNFSHIPFFSHFQDFWKLSLEGIQQPSQICQNYKGNNNVYFSKLNEILYIFFGFFVLFFSRVMIFFIEYIFNVYVQQQFQILHEIVLRIC